MYIIIRSDKQPPGNPGTKDQKAEERTMKARVFNIMQYVNHPETGEPLLDEDIIKLALAHRTVKQWAYVLHDKDVYSEADEADDPNHKAGNQKPLHWHIVLNCMNTAVEIGSVAKWFGIAENFVDVPKGNGAGKFLDCVEYLTHESAKQQELGKHRYADEEIHASAGFNWREKLDKRNDNKIKYGRDLDDKDQMRYDVLYNGKTLRQCMAEDKLLYMDDIERLKKLRMEYISNQKPPATRINYYVTGRGGVGKGLICRAIARSLFPQLEDDEDIFFEVGAKGAAFEGYDGQPVIIWNDRRAIDLLQELNGRGNVFNVFDTHPTKQKQNIKYGSINLCNVVNIVNSVQEYEEFLNGLAGEYTDRDGNLQQVEDKGQSYRRFPFMILLHEEDYDMMLNKGFVENTKDFEEYLQYNHIRGNMQRIAERCGNNEALARKLQGCAVQPIVDKHNEVMQKMEHWTEDEEAILAEFADLGKQIPEPVQMEMSEFMNIPDSLKEELPFDTPEEAEAKRKKAYDNQVLDEVLQNIGISVEEFIMLRMQSDSMTEEEIEDNRKNGNALYWHVHGCHPNIFKTALQRMHDDYDE